MVAHTFHFVTDLLVLEFLRYGWCGESKASQDPVLTLRTYTATHVTWTPGHPL